MTSRRSPVAVTAGIALCLSAVLLACTGAMAPTPLGSLPLPSGLPSVDVDALCSATSEIDADLAAVAAAAASAADGEGFELEDAEGRVDDLIGALEGLALTGDVAPARDAAVQALRELRAELPEPGTDTSQAATDALAGFASVRDSLCA